MVRQRVGGGGQNPWRCHQRCTVANPGQLLEPCSRTTTRASAGPVQPWPALSPHVCIAMLLPDRRPGHLATEFVQLQDTGGAVCRLAEHRPAGAGRPRRPGQGGAQRRVREADHRGGHAGISRRPTSTSRTPRLAQEFLTTNGLALVSPQHPNRPAPAMKASWGQRVSSSGDTRRDASLRRQPALGDGTSALCDCLPGRVARPVPRGLSSLGEDGRRDCGEQPVHDLVGRPPAVRRELHPDAVSAQGEQHVGRGVDRQAVASAPRSAVSSTTRR